MNMSDFWSFFAFPLNLILALLWASGLFWLWKSRPECAFVRFILSPAATISAIIMFLTACLWIGFSGERGFVMSVLFVSILLYVQSVLLVVVFRGWRRADGKVRWRFILLHCGLLVALGAGFWGSPDSNELRIALARGQETETAFEMDGATIGLGYRLRLTDYDAEFSTDGKPSYYEAYVSIDGDRPVSVSVNDPYGVKLGEDIYLASVSPEYCVLQIIREPWRYFALVGIIMLLAGAFMLFIKGPGR